MRITTGRNAQKKWLQGLKQNLRTNDSAREALKDLETKGCTQANLLGFLYAYQGGPALVFRDRKRARDLALGGLAGVAGRLTRTADTLEDVLGTPMTRAERFEDWLRERLTARMDFKDGGTGQGAFTPDFLLRLPNELRSYASWTKWLVSQLRPEMSMRRVGRSIYLAQLITYIETVTGTKPSWEELAELIEAGRVAAGSPGKSTDAQLLRKNFESFKSRNVQLYQDIQNRIRDYIASCGLLQSGEKPPTFYGWMERQRTPQP